jgi:hypothetical protein
MTASDLRDCAVLFEFFDLFGRGTILHSPCSGIAGVSKQSAKLISALLSIPLVYSHAQTQRLSKQGDVK